MTAGLSVSGANGYKASLSGPLAHCTVVDGWLPDVENLLQDVANAKRFLNFSPYSNTRRRYSIDLSEFEYCAPGVFYALAVPLAGASPLMQPKLYHDIIRPRDRQTQLTADVVTLAVRALRNKRRQ